MSLHGCSSKVQPLLLTLDEGYLLTAAPPDLERGGAPLGPPAPAQQPLLGRGVAPSATAPSLGRVVAPLGHRSRPWTWGGSSPLLLRQCSIIIREMQIKITVSDYFILLRMYEHEKQNKTIMHEDAEKRLCTVGRMVNWYRQLWKTLWKFSPKLKLEWP